MLEDSGAGAEEGRKEQYGMKLDSLQKPGHAGLGWPR